MYTQNTADCHKWNADDMQKFKPNRCEFMSNNDHALEGNMKACFAKMCKDLKKDLKKKFKSKKNKRKTNKHYGSSDPSDSSDSN